VLARGEELLDLQNRNSRRKRLETPQPQRGGRTLSATGGKLWPQWTETSGIASPTVIVILREDWSDVFDVVRRACRERGLGMFRSASNSSNISTVDRAAGPANILVRVVDRAQNGRVLQK
jgi:hypothetical protein